MTESGTTTEAYGAAKTVPAHPLRVYRVAAGMTQADLADAAGVAHSTVAGLERGEWNPHRLTARALSDALGVTVEDLFPDDERRPAQDAAAKESATAGPTDED